MSTCTACCNAQKCIEGKRQIDIWLVFKNLELEMNFDNFTRATCIPYTDLVEIVNLQLKYKFYWESCTH